MLAYLYQMTNIEKLNFIILFMGLTILLVTQFLFWVWQKLKDSHKIIRFAYAITLKLFSLFMFHTLFFSVPGDWNKWFLHKMSFPELTLANVTFLLLLPYGLFILAFFGILLGTLILLNLLEENKKYF